MSMSMLRGTSYPTFEFEDFVVEEKSCIVFQGRTYFMRPILQKKFNFFTLAFGDIFVKLWFRSGTFVISASKSQLYY